MEKLRHYGKDLTDIYKREMLHQSAYIATDNVLTEWASFEEFMFECHQLCQNSVHKKTSNETDENAISQLIKQYTPPAFLMFVTINFVTIFIQCSYIC